MSESPATPRPAATILLLRHGGRHVERGVEVLMVRRTPKASFMPGVWVFPGGVIEEGESPAECAARELAEEAGVELATDVELVAWSRWITPEIVPVRFDTHFFVARAEPHTKPQPDLTEVTDADWFAPRAALDAHEAGELELVFPTIKTLETLVSPPDRRGRDRDRADAADRADRAAGRRHQRRTIGSCCPWEDGYEDAVTDPGKLAP